MTPRVVLAAALIAMAGAALAQKGDSGKRDKTLDTSRRPIPEKCAGLTGDQREACIKKEGSKPKR